MKKTRLDILLVQHGYCATTDEAVRLVYARKVKVGDEFASSPALLVEPDAKLQVKGADRFVSRGGYKLATALEAFAISVEGKRCIDVGCSTGGFSDCLLQAGSASVACVDVGYGDLAWKVRSNPRVTVFERTNIRTADPQKLGAPFDVVVADLSFIGLASLAPMFAQLCQPGSVAVVLVKPQFESAYGETLHGVVVDEAVRTRTVEEVQRAFETAGFSVRGTIESPITGKRGGNVEYLVHAVYSPADPA